MNWDSNPTLIIMEHQDLILMSYPHGALRLELIEVDIINSKGQKQFQIRRKCLPLELNSS